MKSRVAAFLSLVLCFSIMVPSLAQASSIPHKETVIFNSDSKDGTYEFDEKIEVNRVKYNLSTVEYKLVSTQKKQIEGEVTHVEKSAPVLKGSTVDFPETVTVVDEEFKLKEIRTVEAAEKHAQQVTQNTDYEYYVTRDSIPQTKTVTVKNEVTGIEEAVECTLSDVSKHGNKWVKSHIDIKFSDYDSTAISWRGLYFANKPTETPLKGYESELLASVDLNANNGKVLKTYWTSEPYTANEVVYREAKADIEKLVPVYRATYTGEIKEDMVIQEAVYTGKGMVETNEDEYTIEAVAYYEEDTMSDFMKAAGLFLLTIMIIILIVLTVARKKLSDKIKEIKNRKNNV